MHYSELHGDMPINALQAFGGYMAMGDILGGSFLSQAKAGSISFEDALNQFLASPEGNPSIYTGPRTSATSPTVFEDALLSFITAAASAGKISQATANSFGQFQAANKGKLDLQVAQAKIAIKAGLSTTHKVLIGVGIVGLLAGGYYLYSKND